MNALKPLCTAASIARALVLVPLAAVSLLCGTVRADSPAFADFAKVVVVTPSAAIVPSGDTAYANVPVLLRLSEDISGFSYADFQRADHGDLAVYDETMTSLPYEVQVWDETGESLVWVKVPQFSALTSLLVAYGCADAVENDPSAVWGAYAIATHLDELGAAGTVADATGNGHDGTCWSGSTGLTGGVFGGYRDNRPAGAEGQGGISFADTVSMNLGQNFTLETWVQLHALSTGWDHLFYKKEESGSWEGFATELYSEGGRFGQLSINGRGGNDTGCKINHGIAAVDTWYHIQLVFDGTTIRLYNNGALMGTGSLAADRHATWNRSVNVTLGADSDQNSGTWNGAFDEFRLIGESFDNGRAALEYGAQTDGAFSYEVRNNTGTAPQLEAPAVSIANGVFSVTATLSGGTATSVKAIFNGDVEVEMAPSGATAPWTATVAVSSALAADTTYALTLRAVNADDFSSVVSWDGTLYTGAVAVEKTADAREEGLVPGSFTFRRADTAHDLTVNYTVGGTAVPGQTYEPLSGSIVIPAGATSATVAVQPKTDGFTDDDATVVATVAEGMYAGVGASASLTIANARNPAFATYARRLPLAVAEGRYSGGAVADVPVLVRLRETAGGFSYADFMRTDYEDLAFIDEVGTILPYEVQTWNPGGESLVWVKVPTLGPATTIYALYGSEISGRTATADVWSGYTAVWHMDETEAGAVTLNDATANALNGTYGFNSSSADGLFGTSRRMCTGGGTPEAQGRALVPAPDAVFKGADNNQRDRQYLSASMWVKLEGSTSWAYLLTRKDADSSKVWGFQIDDSNKNMRFWGDGGTSTGMGWGGGNFPSGWVKFDMVYDGGTYVFYVNGVETSRATGKNWSNGGNNTSAIAVGGPVGSGTYGTFNGDMEEVRLIAGSVSSADRIKVQYLSESDADFFVQGVVAVVDTSRPAVGYVQLEDVDGVATLAIPLEAGSGNVYAVVRDQNGTVATNLIESGLSAPAVATLPVASLSASPAWFDVASYAENGSQHDSRDYAVRVFTGAASVAKCFDACRDDLVEGAFKVTVDTGAAGALAEPLAIPYTLSGTAVSGTDYAALSGVATIPAGASSVFLPIVPLANGAAGEVTVTLQATACPVVSGKASASLLIQDAGTPISERQTRFSATGYSGETVAGFPALIRLHEGDGNFSYDNVRYHDTGADIHFTLDDGTPVPHEIDTWNYGGESTIWVRLPELRANAAVILRCGATAQTTAPTDVWTGMAGVWHMVQDASGYFPNRASASNQGRAWNSNSSDSDGIVGGARRISNADSRNQGNNSVTASNNDVFDVGSTLTFSAWLRYKQGQVPGWDRIVGRKNAYNSADGWEISLSQDQPSGIDIRGGAQSSTGGNDFFATPVNDGEWHYVTVVYEDTSVTAYENGVVRHTGTIATGPIDNDRDLSFGNNSPRSEVTFKGTLDEIRLCSGALSAARIRADYLTVTSDLLKAQEGFAMVVLLR